MWTERLVDIMVLRGLAQRHLEKTSPNLFDQTWVSLAVLLPFTERTCHLASYRLVQLFVLCSLVVRTIVYPAGFCVPAMSVLVLFRFLFQHPYLSWCPAMGLLLCLCDSTCLVGTSDARIVGIDFLRSGSSQQQKISISIDICPYCIDM